MIKNSIVLISYTCVLLFSEIAYRVVFHIPALARITESFLVILVFVALYFFARYKITRIVIAVFFGASILLNNIHYEVYQSWINSINYYLMIKDATEVIRSSGDFVYKVLPVTLWGVVEILFFLSLGYWRRKTSAIADAVFLLMMLYIFVRSFSTNHEFGISPKPSYPRLKSNYFSFGYFVGRILPYHYLNLTDLPYYSEVAPKKIAEPEINNIIFVVGESATASHLSVFGYTRPTTPFLEQLSSRYPQAIVKPIYSAGFMTAVSLPTLFNAIPYPNGLEQIIKGDTNLFRLAKAQGYATYFHSSQPENEMSIISLIGKKWIDHLTFPTQLGYQTNEGMSDNLLLPYLYQTDFNKTKNFFILHQRGSHVPYGHYLTEEEVLFKGNTPLDNYDNTIVQLDSFLEKTLTHLSQYQDDWVLIYTSDHGQNVTNKVFNQGTTNPDSYIVPLVIYTPNKALQQKLNQTFSGCQTAFHQQIATLLMNIMGYDKTISSCLAGGGVVTGNIITGDAGYLRIQADGTTHYVYPNAQLESQKKGKE